MIPRGEKKPRPFFAFGNAVEATIAIGNVAHGTLAIGFSLSVGVVAIGLNAVGSLAAFGLNAAAPIAVAAINAVGVFALAGVNGFATIGAAGVNSASHPLVGLVASTIIFIVALVHYNAIKESGDPEPKPVVPDTVPLSVACERGGWVRAERLAVRGDRVTLHVERASIEAQIGPGLEAGLRALEPGAALGAWLARSKSTHVVFAGAGVGAAMVATIVSTIG